MTLESVLKQIAEELKESNRIQAELIKHFNATPSIDANKIDGSFSAEKPAEVKHAEKSHLKYDRESDIAEIKALVKGNKDLQTSVKQKLQDMELTKIPQGTDEQIRNILDHIKEQNNA